MKETSHSTGVHCQERKKPIASGGEHHSECQLRRCFVLLIPLDLARSNVAISFRSAFFIRSMCHLGLATIVCFTSSNPIHLWGWLWKAWIRYHIFLAPLRHVCLRRTRSYGMYVRYAGHSETILRQNILDDDQQPLWWAKGGTCVRSLSNGLTWSTFDIGLLTYSHMMSDSKTGLDL